MFPIIQHYHVLLLLYIHRPQQTGSLARTFVLDLCSLSCTVRLRHLRVSRPRCSRGSAHTHHYCCAPRTNINLEGIHSLQLFLLQRFRYRRPRRTYVQIKIAIAHCLDRAQDAEDERTKAASSGGGAAGAGGASKPKAGATTTPTAVPKRRRVAD